MTDHSSGQSECIALDRASSVRSYDVDGRLRVGVSNISKATVNGYLGSEIPAEGLDKDRVYQMLRDPEELKKAASSFNGLPLLRTHAYVSADEPKKDKVIGSLGTDAEFKSPFLRNSLIVWDSEAIAAIESGDQRQLSCGYRYRADMTPGVFDGVAYDGVMRDITGNHVALVEVGRAGPEVVVGDEAIKETDSMAKSKLAMAADAKAKDEDKIDEVTDPEKTNEDSEREETDAIDEDDDEDDKKPAEDEKEEDLPKPKKPGMDSKPRRVALDADAIRAEVRREFVAIEDAKSSVRALVGEVHGLDSAEAIYRFALDRAGIDVKGVHPSALPVIVKLASDRATSKPRKIASDAAVSETIRNIPGAMRLRNGGK